MRQGGLGARPRTETVGRHAAPLDQLDGEAMTTALIESQGTALAALRAAQTQIDRAIAMAASVMRRSGSRLIYCGAGTSGRIALLDAVELKPTFNWPDERLEVLLAGGAQSFYEAQEGAEDDGGSARAALNALDVSANDVVVGLAASGTTPYVLQAMETARERAATTIGLANNPGAPLLSMVDCPVLLDTGPEILAGSTRLTAGTSQKIALNTFSTGLMVRLGRVYKGYMVDMRATNAKLRVRAVTIVSDIAGCDDDAAQAALDATGYDIKRAVLVAAGATPDMAARLLGEVDGNLGAALTRLAGA